VQADRSGTIASMSRTRVLLTFTGIAAIVIAAVLAYWSFSESAQVDACQDQGGQYDYAAKSCIGSRYEK
jgi:hypothetical protein